MSPRRLAALACAGLALFAADSTRGDETSSSRARLIVLTDVGSLTTGVAEPDDGQSLIRLMLYANDFDVEGLVATSNMRHGRKVRPDLVHRVIDAYAEVLPNLRLHDPRYPPADALHALVKSGTPEAGPEIAVDRCVGEGKDTEGSQWIIEAADRPDPRPIRVLIWGGSADLAQALDRVRRDRGPAGASAFTSKLRVHAIGDQDASGPWIRLEFPGLSYLRQEKAYRGMYRGGDGRSTSSTWVRAHVHGHGALGDLYPDYNGGDIWTARLGKVRGVKEGDTPSLLAHIPNGLTDLDRPELGGWGGLFAGEQNRLVDVADPERVVPADPDPRLSSVHRWRPAFQADFQARLDWCVHPFAEANHPPIAQVDGARERTAVADVPIDLSAEASTDPDGDQLTFAWSVHPWSPEFAAGVSIEGSRTSRARITFASSLAGRTVPILLAATDRGAPRLVRYARVLIRVEPPK